MDTDQTHAWLMLLTRRWTHLAQGAMNTDMSVSMGPYARIRAGIYSFFGCESPWTLTCQCPCHHDRSDSRLVQAIDTDMSVLRRSRHSHCLYADVIHAQIAGRSWNSHGVLGTVIIILPAKVTSLNSLFLISWF